MKNKNGQVLVGAAFVLIIVCILGMIAASMISTGSFSAAANLQGIQALNIAEAGMRFTVATSLAADTDFTDNINLGPISLSPGTFSVRYISAEVQKCTIEVTGTVGNVSRVIRSGFKKGVSLGDLAKDYTLYLGSGSGGSTSVGQNTTFNGDIFMHGNVTFGQNTTVTGDAYSTGSITGGTVDGTREPNDSLPAAIPTLETTYYDQQIAYAASSGEAPKTYSQNNTYTLSGFTYIKGAQSVPQNVTFNVSGSATLVVSGNLTISQGCTFGDHLTVISGGTITIGQNVNIGRYGLWYARTAITVSQGADVSDLVAGTGTAFISPGNVSFGQNATFDGLIYAGGTLTLGQNTNFNGLIVANRVDSIGQNSTFTIGPSEMNYDNITGLEGGGANVWYQFGWAEYY